MHHILEEIPLFDGVESNILETIFKHVSIEKYKRNQVIICEGGTNEHFYIVKKGEVKVYRTNKYGQHIILALLQEGEFFGELSILDEDIASANVATMQPTELICIHDRQFLKMMKTIPSIANHLFYYMTQRIRYCDESIENLNRPNSYDRVGSVLISLAEKKGYRKNSSVIINKIPFQHNIASLAGTSRETVSRAFTQFEESAYITKTGRHLVINDYPRFYEEFTQ
ncbi:MAG: Crp/Fnr family transcriptional regulator [Candidatus Marinimicrobia bacterium]|nr:Crp/Fnr family transcriptional regulator [Candidatus Neomarinimicrobiota bacterium]